MAEKPKKQRINFRTLLLVLIIGGLILFTVLGIDGPKKIWRAILGANPFWLIISILAFLMAWFIEGTVLDILVKQKAVPDLKLKDSINLTIIGKLFDNLTPMATGGQPFQVWKMYKLGSNVGTAISVLTLKFIAYQMAITVIYFVVIIANLKTIIHWQPFYIGSIVIGMLITIMAAVFLILTIAKPNFIKNIARKLVRMLRRIKLIDSQQKTLNRLNKEIDSFHDNLMEIYSNKMVVAKIFLLSVIQILLVFSVGFFVFLSLGSKQYDLLAAISASAYVWLVCSFIPLPGASLGAEGAFLLFFGLLYGKDDSLALAMLIWRSIVYYMPIAVGLIFLFDYKHITKSKLIKKFTK